MAEEIRIAAAAEIPEGQARQFQVKDRIIAVFHLGDEFFATDELCTHRAGPLSEGKIEGGVVVCPWHHAKFEIATGKCVDGPGKRDLRKYPVAVRENTLWISL